MTRVWVGALVAIAVTWAMVVAGCSDDGGDEAETTSTTTTTTDPSEDTGDSDDDATTTSSSTPEDEDDDLEDEGFFASDLTFDADGRLWATSETGINAHGYRELYGFTGTEWVPVLGSRIFSDPIEWELRAAAGGGVYLAADDGVAWTDGLTWELYEQEFLCGSLAVDTSGQLWATCPDFLVRLVDGEWVEVPEGGDAASVAAGSDGGVWVTTFTLPIELMRLEDGSWASVPCEDCLGARSILGIDEAGTAWVARGSCGLDGLSTFDPVTMQSTPIEDVVGAGDVAFTADGAVWLAVKELQEFEVCGDRALPVPGLVRIDPDGSQRRYTTEDGLLTDDVQAVEVDPDGTLYVATSRGVSIYDPEKDRLVPTGPVAVWVDSGDEAACAYDGPVPDDPLLAELRTSYDPVARSVDALFDAVDANDDFATGWIDRGDVGAAAADLTADVQVMSAAAAAVLEGRGWSLVGDEWDIPDGDLPVSPSLAAVEEIWRSTDGFRIAIENLGGEDARAGAIWSWTTGGAPCGTAATIADTLLPAALGHT